jgi:hypothetical protein
MTTITHPELHGLLAIAREEGLDMKPVLLRVLTDLYVSAAVHTSNEATQFREIATALIAQVDIDTALFVACKLCDYAATPLAVGEAFLARGDDSARIVLADAAWLPRHHVEEAAAGADRILAAAVAARADLGADLARLLADRDDPVIDVTLAANTAAALPRDVLDLLLDRSRDENAIAQALLSRSDLTSADRAVLFLDADKAGRRQIIVDAESPVASNGRHLERFEPPDDIALPLESAALARDERAFRAILALGLGVDPRKLDRLLADRTGEGPALALVALGIPDDVATRIFMFRDPMIGHSTDRCYALVDLSRRVSPPAAQRIICAMLGIGARAPSRHGTHVPASDPAERGALRHQGQFSSPHAEARRAMGG